MSHSFRSSGVGHWLFQSQDLKSKGDHDFAIRAFQMWNDLPEKIRLIKSVTHFIKPIFINLLLCDIILLPSFYVSSSFVPLPTMFLHLLSSLNFIFFFFCFCTVLFLLVWLFNVLLKCAIKYDVKLHQIKNNSGIPRCYLDLKKKSVASRLYSLCSCDVIV